jgi:lipid-A-disaccharide synthase
MSALELFISAGEISGDFHGGRLLAALRLRHPGLSAFGIGGRQLERAGMEKIADISRLSLVGITEVAPRLISLYRLFSRTKKAIRDRRPVAVLLVDSPDFNLPLARHAQSLGIKVIYYISPTVWAWRSGRIRSIRRYVDLMLTILPFEDEIYRRNGIRSEYVGNPLVDRADSAVDRGTFFEGLGLEEDRDLIALLPGSRLKEVQRLLPLLLDAGQILAHRSPPPCFVFPAASREIADHIRLLTEKALPGSFVVTGRAVDSLGAATAAVVTSGTATLETALQGTPFVTVYRLSTLSYIVGRLLVRTPWISLPNILLQQGVVEELIQQDCRPERIASATARFLDDSDAVFHMKEQFAIMREKLGPGGAAERAAAAVAAEIGLDRFLPGDGAPAE